MNIVCAPAKQDFQGIADVYNKSHERFLNIYSEEEQKVFARTETKTSIEEMSERRDMLCVKNDAGMVIGYAAFRLKNEQTVWLSALYVLPDCERRGVGKVLLCGVERWAKEKGAKVVVLETHRNADWAINFYTKNGYELINDKAKLKVYPFDRALEKDPVAGRPFLGKILQ